MGQKFGECYPSVCSFYQQIGLKGHNGIDSGAYHGQPVYAAHDGEVVFAGEDGSAGLGVVIRTTQQFDYKDGQAYYKTIYWHLKKGGIRVTAGQKVRTGEVIALADNTGFSTGDHLHFGLKPVYAGENDWTWWNSEQENGYKGAIDPAPHFTGLFAVDMYCYSFGRSMQFGDEGEDVKALQTVLQNFGDFPIAQETTTFYGKITEAAVKSYQKRTGIVTWGSPALTGYGRFGPKTRASINNLVGMGF